MEEHFGNKIILASASPRRSFLLEKCGVPFEVVVSDAEEVGDIPGGKPADTALHNALLKAEAVARRHSGKTVLGADTIVVLDGETLGKPADKADAKRMLGRLSGRTHRVVTACALLNKDAEISESFYEETPVTFKTLADADIESYMRLVNVMDKAGSYGIQEHGELVIEKIDGNADNVMGLPCALLKERLDGVSRRLSAG